jgi:hypothetical protein
MSSIAGQPPVNCPRCATQMSADARMCPACQFRVWEFNRNRSDSRKSQMHRCQGKESYYLLRLYQQDSKAAGCATIASILGGMVLCIIPIIGWILGPMMMLFGFITLFSPVRGSMFLGRLTGDNNYKKKKAIASASAENTYNQARCPSCGAILAGTTTVVFWPIKGGTIDCGSCKRRSLRFGDTLMYVPYPQVCLTDSVQEYLPYATDESLAEPTRPIAR